MFIWVDIGISIYLKNTKMEKNTGFHHKNIISKKLYKKFKYQRLTLMYE